MSNKTKSLFAFVAALFITVAIAGAYVYPHSKYVVSVNGVGGVGDTNSTSRIASCSLDMSTTTPTTATTTGTGCLYNADSKDRVITSVDYYISGLGNMKGATGGVASTTWQLGTSSNQYVPATGAGSSVLYTTIATSTANGAVSYAGVLSLYVSSTTPGLSATFPVRVWNSGTYLNLLTNATSSLSDGAIGTIVVKYFVNN